MLVIRKRKQSNVTENPNKKQCDINKIFDSEDDNLILSAMSSTSRSQGLPVFPADGSRTVQQPRPPPMQAGPSRPQAPVLSSATGNVAARMPPPAVKKSPDSPATSADIDRLMSSIGALTGKFDDVKQDITSVAARLDDHSNRLKNSGQGSNNG